MWGTNLINYAFGYTGSIVKYYGSRALASILYQVDGDFVYSIDERENLFLYSEDYTKSYWTKINLTSSGNALTETAIDGDHFISTLYNFIGGVNVKFTFSVTVEPNGRDYIKIASAHGPGGTEMYGMFNLSNGTFVSSSRIDGYLITDNGNGSYTIDVNFTDYYGGLRGLLIKLGSDVSTFSYLGDVTKGIYIHSMQLCYGHITREYVTTTSTTVEYGKQSLDNQGSLGATNDGLCYAGNPLYVGSGNEFDVPLEYTLGSEMFSDPTFDSGVGGFSGWQGAVVSHDADKMKVEMGDSDGGYVGKNFALVEDSVYHFSIDIDYGTTTGNISLNGTYGFTTFPSTPSTGTYSHTFKADITSGNSNYRVQSSGSLGEVFYVDNFTLKEVTFTTQQIAFHDVNTGWTFVDASSFTDINYTMPQGTFDIIARLDTALSTADKALPDLGYQLIQCATGNTHDLSIVQADVTALYVPNTAQGGYLQNIASAYSSSNMFKYSEEIDNAVWSKSNVTISTNTITAPDGTTTADLIASNLTWNLHYIYQAVTTTEDVYTISAYIKPNDSSFISIYRWVGAPNIAMTFDLSTKTVTTSVGLRGTITDVGNGWYRISCTFSAVSSSSAIEFRLSAGSSSSPLSMYIWGTQIEKGYVPTTYAKTTSAAITGGTPIEVALVPNYSQTTNYDNTDFNQKGVQTLPLVIDGTGRVTDIDYSKLHFNGDGRYVDTGWIPSADEDWSIEYIVDVLSFSETQLNGLYFSYDSQINIGVLSNGNFEIKVGAVGYVTSVSLGKTYIVVNRDNISNISSSYINGLLKDQRASTYTSSLSFGLGRRNRSTGGDAYLKNPTRLFKVHNKVLTQEEITKNYNDYVAQGLLS